MDVTFMLEIFLRTLIMFFMVLLVLRLSGKKGVRQLSLFEVAIIIGLGSAAGDPMFNKDVPILPAILVFATILIFYRIVTYIASKSDRFEKILEGESVYIIEDGEFFLGGEAEYAFARDEFFAEMRQQSVEHVGQVRVAVLETNGNVSFFYYEDSEVKPGLPVLPKPYANQCKHIEKSGLYACTYCARVTRFDPGKPKCPRCEKETFVPAIQSVRIS